MWHFYQMHQFGVTLCISVPSTNQFSSIFHPWSFSVPQSYIYGSPYMGAAPTQPTSATGLVQNAMMPATQLSHAAAIAQFYEYQVTFHPLFWNLL